MSGEWTTALISFCSLLTMASGVLAGASMPIQELETKPGTPDSETVGTFGSEGRRASAAGPVTMLHGDLPDVQAKIYRAEWRLLVPSFRFITAITTETHMAQAQPLHSGAAQAGAQQGRSQDERPVILITGASGNLGRSIAKSLQGNYRVVGVDRKAVPDIGFPMVEADLSSDESVAQALKQLADVHGRALAAVIHLIAFFDSTGEDNPLYETVNIQGTRRLVQGLHDFKVERFIYASTMLVHAPARPGEYISEDSPFGPLYVYPRSKLAAEEVIHAEHGDMPFAILRFAGVYDEETGVPTLAQQIARIYERDFESYFYSSSTLVGQSMLHREDMIGAVRLTVERRNELPAETALLIGEQEGIGYDALQDEIGYLIHGQEAFGLGTPARPEEHTAQDDCGLEARPGGLVRGQWHDTAACGGGSGRDGP